MKFTGTFKDLKVDWVTGDKEVTFTLNERSALTEIEKLRTAKKLNIEVKRFFKSHSLDANRLLWACIGELAEALNTDKWSVYLSLLRDYGVSTVIWVKPEAVEATKEQWRESEVLGTVNVDGAPAVQMLCYFGSHTYNTKEFSRLLDGTISEMEAAGLQPPTSAEMQASLDRWEEILKKGYGAC